MIPFRMSRDLGPCLLLWMREKYFTSFVWLALTALLISQGLILVTARSAVAATCSVSGLWSDTYGANISVAAGLSGVMKLPYCEQIVHLTISLAGEKAFKVNGRYGASDCQGFTESLEFGADCSTAYGTFVNDDGSSGFDTWVKTGPTISLNRSSLTSIVAAGSPAGGVFNISYLIISGVDVAAIGQASGFSTASNPDVLAMSAPGGGGAPTPGGLETLVVKYSVSGVEAKNDLNTIATFGMSCYMVALEADYGSPPSGCSSTRIAGVAYSGVLTNPNGLVGDYCASFIANVRLQGTGRLNSGNYINYSPSARLMRVVDQVVGADGTPVIAGGTVARDRNIIPGKGVLVDVDGVANGLLANDVGGAIRGYRLDIFNGAGRAACAGYSNPHGVGVCQPAQGSTCPGRELK